MGHTCDWDSFLTFHKDQLISSGVPQHFWNAIYTKLRSQTFDIGNVVRLLKFENDESNEPQPNWGLQTTSDIEKNDANNVFLIDHAWTFRIENAKKQLKENENLRDRIINILNINGEKDSIVDEIFDKMWPLCFTYSISNAPEVEDRLPVWYVMDEIGSALIHSNNPNCRIVPFYSHNEQTMYSLLFLIENIDEDEFLTADFTEGVQGEIKKKIAAIPYNSCEFLDEIDPIPKEVSPEYYLEGHIAESLPNLLNFDQKIQNSKLKVYSQYSLIHSYLTSELFEIVNEESQADVLWLIEHFKKFQEFSETPNKFINQFPFEHVLTVKDLLVLTCRNSEGTYWPSWLPVTYNLKTEIENFVAFYKKSNKNDENVWIVKPFNLARGMDTYITKNLNFIIKLANTSTPKIVQKYITNPVLFYRDECNGNVKFDIRYVVLLKSTKPLQVFVYKNFFIRFANLPFELNDFDVYEKHFTVMNYKSDVELKHMLCDEFLRKWNENYPRHCWETIIEPKIFNMFKQIFTKSIEREPPMGIGENPQSRALYAADLMLEWDQNVEIQPKILEINWTPDCKRACEYYPNFYNDIFELLFFDKESSNIIELK